MQVASYVALMYICYLLTSMSINVHFCSYAIITVGPTMTALTVQEPDQMAVIQIMNFAASFPPGTVPFTITYITTDGTATGRLPNNFREGLYIITTWSFTSSLNCSE